MIITTIREPDACRECSCEDCKCDCHVAAPWWGHVLYLVFIVQLIAFVLGALDRDCRWPETRGSYLFPGYGAGGIVGKFLGQPVGRGEG